MARLYLYRQYSNELWICGYYSDPEKRLNWVSVSSHRTPDAASRHVHLLNYREARNPTEELVTPPRSLFEAMNE
jgi:hypothetical protein